MAFRFDHGDDYGDMAEINVTPLVDVMLVLLIIFMITAPMIQRGVDVKLPVASRTDQIVGERVFVTVPLAYRQNHLVQIGDEFIRAEILQERIRQKMETATDKRIVRLRDIGALHANFARELSQAFQFMQMLRLDGQLAASAGTSGTLVRPSSLSSMERDLLRDAFQVVKQFRELIRRHFNLGVF